MKNSGRVLLFIVVLALAGFRLYRSCERQNEVDYNSQQNMEFIREAIQKQQEAERKALQETMQKQRDSLFEARKKKMDEQMKEMQENVKKLEEEKRNMNGQTNQ